VKLAGISEIAALLGVSRQRANQLAKREDFPRPLDRIASGPVWKRSDIERWAKSR
jgi:predicted DNA-binding transcriptional regulator AlpA